ncbi:uncharacterized protein [Littorina saxatilis]|uniref:Uncharacterized protein n=1 Tax=Littorina saxatilis TaxID=31220 RepID=A0AAN9GF58_9CAEN
MEFLQYRRFSWWVLLTTVSALNTFCNASKHMTNTGQPVEKDESSNTTRVVVPAVSAVVIIILAVVVVIVCVRGCARRTQPGDQNLVPSRSNLSHNDDVMRHQAASGNNYQSTGNVTSWAYDESHRSSAASVKNDYLMLVAAEKDISTDPYILVV